MEITSSWEFDAFKNCGIPGAGRVMNAVFGEGNFSQIPKHVLEEAGNRGKKVHEAIELFSATGEENIELKYLPYFDQFLEWNAKYRPTFLGVEVMLVSEALGFKGIIDTIIVDKDGNLVMLDYKTSGSLDVFKATIQLNMYLLLIKEFYPSYHTNMKLKVLQLSKKDYSYIDIIIDENLVLALLKLYEGKKNIL